MVVKRWRLCVICEKMKVIKVSDRVMVVVLDFDDQLRPICVYAP